MYASSRWLRSLCLLQVVLVVVVCHTVDENGTSGGEVVSLDKSEVASLRSPEGGSSVRHPSKRAGHLGEQNSKATAAKKKRARVGGRKTNSEGAATPAHSSKTLFIHDKRGRRKYNYAHVYDYAMKRRRILAERARKKERHTKEHAKKKQEKDGKTERRQKERQSKQERRLKERQSKARRREREAKAKARESKRKETKRKTAEKIKQMEGKAKEQKQKEHKTKKKAAKAKEKSHKKERESKKRIAQAKEKAKKEAKKKEQAKMRKLNQQIAKEKAQKESASKVFKREQTQKRELAAKKKEKAFKIKERAGKETKKRAAEQTKKCGEKRSAKAVSPAARKCRAQGTYCFPKAGRGRVDFMRIAATYAHPMRSNGDGKFKGLTAKYPGGWNFGTNLNHWQTVVGDWNGDRKTDFLRISPTYAHSFISRGDGTFKAGTAKYPGGWNFGTNLAVWQTAVGDWNGDGKTDFMRIAATYAHTFISKGDGTFKAGTAKYPGGWNFGHNLAHWQTVVGDWNGDGKTDFMRISPTYAHSFISRGDGTFKAGTAKYPGGWNFGTNLNQWATAVGDWNGDGKTDFIRVSPTYAHTFISNGDGTFRAGTAKYPGGWNFGTNLNHWQLVVGDWNGDGKTDFLRISPTYAHSFISRGDGTFKAGTAKYPGGWNFGTNLAVWQTAVGDWNGDGKTDFMRIAATYAHTFISKGDGTFKAGTAKYPGGWNFGHNLAQWQTVVGQFVTVPAAKCSPK